MSHFYRSDVLKVPLISFMVLFSVFFAVPVFAAKGGHDNVAVAEDTSEFSRSDSSSSFYSALDDDDGQLSDDDGRLELADELTIKEEVEACIRAGFNGQTFIKTKHLSQLIGKKLYKLGLDLSTKAETEKNIVSSAKPLSLELISDIQSVSKDPSFGKAKDSLLKAVNEFVEIVEKNDSIVNSVVEFLDELKKNPLVTAQDKKSIPTFIAQLTKHFDEALHTICSRFANKIKNDTSVAISAKERAYLVRTIKALLTDFKDEEVAILISSKTSSIREEIKNYNLVGEQITEDDMETLVAAFSNQGDKIPLININTNMWSYLHGYVQAVALMMEKENPSRPSDLKPHRAEPSSSTPATAADAVRVLELIAASAQ